MNTVGVREVVALGALAVAGFIGFLFLDPTSTESTNHTPGDIHLGEAPPTATPTLEPTATPVPVSRVAPPANWQLSLYERAVSGGDILTGTTFVEALDMEAEGSPFTDMRDDAWSAAFEADVATVAGRNGFELEYDCELVVLADGAEVFRAENPDGARRAEVVFDHAGGKTRVRIEARDGGGPFVVRWAAD